MEIRSVCPVLLSLLFGIQVLAGQGLSSAEVLEDRLAKELADAEIEQKAALKTLDEQFLRRLEVLGGGFEKAGDKNGVEAAGLMKQSIGVDAPASPEGSWPKSVQDSRRIYDEARAGIVDPGKRSALRLRGKLARSLEILEAELTAKGELEEARKVEQRIKVYALTDEQQKAAGLGMVQFFGAEVDVNRVVFVVDFSGSMSEGARLPSLKKELDEALRSLPRKVFYNVIYYSHRPWLGGEDVGSAPFRDVDDQQDRIPWRVANAANVKESREQLAEMRLGGATNWIMPLRLALAMAPAPEAICFITDGEASDRQELVEDLDKINPGRVPIHTCSMELGGPVFESMIGIAEGTGGSFSIVHDGVLHTGEKARKFAGKEFAPHG